MTPFFVGFAPPADEGDGHASPRIENGDLRTGSSVPHPHGGIHILLGSGILLADGLARLRPHGVDGPVQRVHDHPFYAVREPLHLTVEFSQHMLGVERVQTGKPLVSHGQRSGLS